MQRERNYPLRRLNTFGVEAAASEYIQYDTEDELVQLAPALGAQPLLHIGGGSNLLFTRDFPGTVLHSNIRGMAPVDETPDHVLVRVGAGEVWDDFVAEAVRRGWHGVENLSLIPGEVGAAAVQNIGAYGAEAKDVVAAVECVELRTGQKRVLGNLECNYAYRQSIFKQELRGQYAVTYVTFRLARRFVPLLDYGGLRARLSGGEATPERVRQAVIAVRNEKLPDPGRIGNAGSFFMNPVVPRAQFLRLQADHPSLPHYDVDADRVKIPAGWMIEQCGWKGRALGRAGVYGRQALVLVNLGGATGADILRLSDAVCQSVKSKFGIDIHPEVNVI